MDILSGIATIVVVAAFFGIAELVRIMANDMRELIEFNNRLRKEVDELHKCADGVKL